MSRKSWMERLRGTQITSDAAFDRLVPQHVRHLSAVHWTPLDVAVRVAVLLAPAAHERVLDVGSGIGKLCIIGAMSSRGIWCGVEKCNPLVVCARKLAHELGVAARTQMIYGDIFALDWAAYDALYFFNPFEQPMSGRASDHRWELSYPVASAEAQRRLALLRPGTRVVTLNGFGGVMPATFRLLLRETIARFDTELVMWLQTDTPAKSTWQS